MPACTSLVLLRCGMLYVYDSFGLLKRRTSTNMNQTQNQLWKDRVQGILNGLDVFFKDGVMTEVACENNGMCNLDQRSFKAYLARWLGYTAIVAPWTREQASCDYTQCT